MGDYWFGRKRIGWGLRPINFMGWMLTLIFAGIVVMLYLQYAAAGDMAGFALWGGVSFVIFVAIALLKLEPKGGDAAPESSESSESSGDGD